MRHTIPLLVLLLGAFSVTNAEEPAREPAARNLTESLQHDGVTRTYHIRLPPGFQKTGKHPLVLALHGGGGRGKLFDRSTSGTLTAAGDKRGFVLVFPEGVDRRWHDGRTKHLHRWSRRYDDVGFLSAVIDRMTEHYGVDTRRVYATGISNGGLMSIRLAMDLTDKVAAIAPVTAALTQAISHKRPKQPISVMMINGTKDPLVPYAGGDIRLFNMPRSRGVILSTAETIERFRTHNGCRKKPVVTEVPDSCRDDGSRVMVKRYSDGQQGTSVVLVKVIGGGHTWPGGTQYLPVRRIGPVCRDFEASEMILDFFLAHPRK